MSRGSIPVGGAVTHGGAANVLIVEDDPRILQALTLALGDHGYVVEGAGTGERALELVAGDAHPDVVLLDLMLPGIDGFEVCRQIRALGDLPIIMVTARSDPGDIIAGLEAGADDYVTKPLDAGELAARIRALLRRARSEDEPSMIVIGDVRVDLARGQATRAGQPLHLTKTETRVLSELSTAKGRVVTREELLSRVWQYDYFGDTRLLDVHIRRLRRKIETDPDQPQRILTVRGVGYRLVQ